MSRNSNNENIYLETRVGIDNNINNEVDKIIADKKNIKINENNINLIEKKLHDNTKVEYSNQ